MKNLYIIGARGFGREVYFSLMRWGVSEHYHIKGFLDDNSNVLDGKGEYPPIVSSVEGFHPTRDDVFVCGLGAVAARRKYIQIVMEKGGRFDNMIAPRACVTPTAKLGQGVWIGGGSEISADVSVGDFALVFTNVIMGHDVSFGAYSVAEHGVFMGGYASVGEGATLHTRSIILPHKTVGADAVVGAGSVVVRNVKPETTVMGNPAKMLSF